MAPVYRPSDSAAPRRPSRAGRYLPAHRPGRRCAPWPKPRRGPGRAPRFSESPRSGPCSRRRAPADVIEKRPQRPQLLGGVFDRAGVADYHHRATDQRMMQRRAGKHQPVDQGGGDTNGQARASLGGEHRAAAGGAVKVQGFAAAGVRRRQHHRPTSVDIAEVTDQRLVEDAMDDLAVVAGAFPVAGRSGSCCGSVCP